MKFFFYSQQFFRKKFVREILFHISFWRGLKRGLMSAKSLYYRLDILHGTNKHSCTKVLNMMQIHHELTKKTSESQLSFLRHSKAVKTKLLISQMTRIANKNRASAGVTCSVEKLLKMNYLGIKRIPSFLLPTETIGVL